MNDKILVIGGYGAVGSIISTALAKQFPHKVIAAGRSFEKAKALAATSGQAIIPARFEAQHFQAHMDLLAAVKLVIMCIDQEDTRFMSWCMEAGIDYIDITASQQLIEKAEQLDTLAKKYQTRLLLSVGLAPGITNLLAQYSLQQFENPELLDIFIVLGLGEQHGDAAYRWTMDNLDRRFTLKQGSDSLVVESFSDPEETMLLGKRTFYRFPFSDQHSLARTTGLPVNTRMAFDARWFTKLIAIMKRLGLSRLFAYQSIQNAAIPLFKKATMGTDVFAVKARSRNTIGTYREAALRGNGEGKVTAYMAVEMALLLLSGSSAPGVWHSHQLVQDIPAFLEQLQQYDTSIRLDL